MKRDINRKNKTFHYFINNSIFYYYLEESVRKRKHHFMFRSKSSDKSKEARGLLTLFSIFH